MGLTLITPPPDAPADLLATVKAHLKLDPSIDEDALVGGYIAAAIRHIEATTWRALVNQTWRLALDTWPCGAVKIDKPPVQSITSVTYVDAAGANQTLASPGYQLDASRSRARLAPAPGTSWPAVQVGRINAVTIDFVAGYGATWAAVPLDIHHALLMLVAHWHGNRETVVVGTISKAVEFSVGELLKPYCASTSG